MKHNAIAAYFALALSTALLPFGQAEAQANATTSPMSSGVSITGNTWSGDVDDSPGGHGAMMVDFTARRFTMSGGDFGGWRRVGRILDFVQTSADEITFTLHVNDTVGCDYGAKAHVENGHLKGSYSGCSIATRNDGTFDLFPVASPTPSPTPMPSTRALRTPRPTRAATPTPDRRALAASAALIAAMRKAEAHYCKTAAQMACSYYIAHAGECLSTALGADAVYQGAIALKRAGYTSTQVQAQEDQMYGPDSEKAYIAAAALRILDEHQRYASGAFEMAIMRLCLSGISK